MCLTNICTWIPFLCGFDPLEKDSFDHGLLQKKEGSHRLLSRLHTIQCCCFSEQTQHVFEIERPLAERQIVPIQEKYHMNPLEEHVSVLFDKYKREKNWLWIKEALLILPKGELHNHLIPDPDDNLAYAAEKGLDYNPTSKLFVPPKKKHSDSDCFEDCCWNVPRGSAAKSTGKEITAKEMQLCSKGIHYQEYFNTVTLSDKGVTDAQNHFFDSFDTILSTDMPLDRQLCGEIKKLMADNIPYGELTIDFQLSNRPVLMNFSLDNLDACYAAIEDWCQFYAEGWVKKLDDCTQQVGKQLNWQHPWNAQGNPITVGFLAEIMRTAAQPTADADQALATFFIDVAATMTLCQKDPLRVLGINVVGPEHNALAKAQRVGQMEVLDYLYHKLGKPNITLHAGEITSQFSLVSDMKDALSLAIDKGHAKRIGHGLCLEKSQKAYALMKKMREKQILIETCLTSNQKIFGVDLQQHPIKTYMQEHVKIALGTDDPHILNTTLTEEFLKAVKNYDCSYMQIKEWIRNSIEFSFLPGETIFDHSLGKTTVKTAFQGLMHKEESTWTPFEKETWDSSWKARMQILVEKNLIEREKEILELHK